MKDSKRSEYVARETIMKLLSDEEVAKVSKAETASSLVEGQEYLDLEHLDLGVQLAGPTTKVTMRNVLLRSAVGAETWSKILATMDY